MMQKIELSKDDKQQLRYNLAKLFFTLTKSNWNRAGSLGTARQLAFKQIESYLNSKDTKNPAVKHMIGLFNENRTNWARMIVESQKGETKLNVPVAEKLKNINLSDKDATAVQNKLNTVVDKFSALENSKELSKEMNQPQNQVQPEQKTQLIPQPQLMFILRQFQKTA